MWFVSKRAPRFQQMPRGKRFVVVDFPVFSDYFVHIEIASDFKKAAGKYPATKSLVYDQDGGEDDGICFGAERSSFIFMKKNFSAGTAAHECWHAVQNMMDFIGAELEAEIVAYHLGHLVNAATALQRRK